MDCTEIDVWIVPKGMYELYGIKCMNCTKFIVWIEPKRMYGLYRNEIFGWRFKDVKVRQVEWIL